MRSFRLRRLESRCLAVALAMLVLGCVPARDDSDRPDGPVTPTSPPMRFEAVSNRNYIKRLTSVQVGVDDDGQPVIDVPKPWVSGTGGADGATRYTLTATFEPAGCGRVMYSTYHTTDEAHHGLNPQERILLYLLLEIGTCSDSPIIL